MTLYNTTKFTATIKKIFTLSLILMLMFIITSCGPSKTEKTIAKVLSVQDVPYTDVKVQGKSLVIGYEASSANNYDSQIVSDWGTIFGTASEFKYDTIIINNKINGKTYAVLSTSRQNVIDYTDGAINESVFWSNVEITSE